MQCYYSFLSSYASVFSRSPVIICHSFTQQTLKDKHLIKTDLVFKKGVRGKEEHRWDPGSFGVGVPLWESSASWLSGFLQGRRKAVTSADQICRKVLRLKSAFREVEIYQDLHICYSASVTPRKLEAWCTCLWQCGGRLFPHEAVGWGWRKLTSVIMVQ